MPTFRSLSEVRSYYNSNNGALLQGNMLKIMQQEAKRLEDILYEEISGYYHSYSPKVYNRTWNLLNSTRISEPMVENGFVTVKVYFDDAMAYHPSVLNGEDGYTPYLISHGYSWRNPRDYEDHFTNYSGYKFITRTLERYSSENPYGIIVKAFFNGVPYEE